MERKIAVAKQSSTSLTSSSTDSAKTPTTTSAQHTASSPGSSDVHMITPPTPGKRFSPGSPMDTLSGDLATPNLPFPTWRSNQQKSKASLSTPAMTIAPVVPLSTTSTTTTVTTQIAGAATPVGVTAGHGPSQGTEPKRMSVARIRKLLLGPKRRRRKPYSSWPLRLFEEENEPTVQSSP